MKVLLTATQIEGSQSLGPVAKELVGRGHEVTIYATGTDKEAKGFNGLEFSYLPSGSRDYSSLVMGHDAVVTGTSGPQRADGYFIRAAKISNIPVVGVVNRNTAFEARFGDIEDLPDFISVPSEDSFAVLRSYLSVEMAREAVARSVVLGRPADDHYAQLKNEFTPEKRTNYLSELDLNSPVHLHATTNLAPEAVYWGKSTRSPEEIRDKFERAMKLTKAVFEAASDFGLKLTVRPHPGEKDQSQYTRNLAIKHGFDYVIKGDMKSLILASYSLTAGPSGCLDESCLLDTNTGAFLLEDEDLAGFTSISSGAIPYTRDWEGIAEILATVTSQDEETRRKLAENRKGFMVDGQASVRIANLVESLKIG